MRCHSAACNSFGTEPPAGREMPVTTKFIIFQFCIFFPFVCGRIMQGRFRDPAVFTGKILRLNIICIEPVIVFWCVWGLQLSSDMLFLPLAGLLLVLTGLLAGIVLAAALGMTGPRKYTWMVSASLANHGFTMGGFLCYLFLGEKGLGLSLILILYFIPYVFGIIFPSLKMLAGGGQGALFKLKSMLLDPQNLPLAAMLIALGLLTADMPRPDIPFPVDVLLYCSISIYYLSLGVTFSKIDFRGMLAEHALMAAVKFLLAPAVAIILAQLLPLEEPARAVIILQGFMPVAIYSVVASVLFSLDARRASSLLVLNTLVFLTTVLPVLFLCRELLPGF